jgi:excinuclease UvrABC nuclease subunit
MSNTPYRYTNLFSVKYQLEHERQPFTREAVRQLPKDRCGLYALWIPTGTEDAQETLYVGQSSTCVRRRLLQHLSDEVNPELRHQLRLFRDLVQFSVAFTEGQQETLELETLVIREWEPETNVYKLNPPKNQRNQESE